MMSLLQDDGFGSLGLSDKFQLIRQVGQTVQNITEDVSNHLEKAQKWCFIFSYTLMMSFLHHTVCCYGINHKQLVKYTAHYVWCSWYH